MDEEGCCVFGGPGRNTLCYMRLVRKSSALSRLARLTSTLESRAGENLELAQVPLAYSPHLLAVIQSPVSLGYATSEPVWDRHVTRRQMQSGSRVCRRRARDCPPPSPPSPASPRTCSPTASCFSSQLISAWISARGRWPGGSAPSCRRMWRGSQLSGPPCSWRPLPTPWRTPPPTCACTSRPARPCRFGWSRCCEKL